MEHECSNYSHENAGTSINGRQSWPRGGAATQPRIRGPYYASKWHKFPCKFGFERCCKIRFQNATTRKYSTSPLRLPRDDSATRTFPLTPTTVWTISLPFPWISHVETYAFPLRWTVLIRIHVKYENCRLVSRLRFEAIPLLFNRISRFATKFEWLITPSLVLDRGAWPAQRFPVGKRKVGSLRGDALSRVWRATTVPSASV